MEDKLRHRASTWVECDVIDQHNSNKAWARHRKIQLSQRVLSGDFLCRRDQKQRMYYDHLQYVHNTKIISIGGNDSKNRVDWRAQTTETNEAITEESCFAERGF